MCEYLLATFYCILKTLLSYSRYIVRSLLLGIYEVLLIFTAKFRPLLHPYVFVGLFSFAVTYLTLVSEFSFDISNLVLKYQNNCTGRVCLCTFLRVLLLFVLFQLLFLILLLTSKCHVINVEITKCHVLYSNVLHTTPYFFKRLIFKEKKMWIPVKKKHYFMIF